MSILSSILEKLGLQKPAAPETPVTTVKPAATTKPPATAAPYTPGHMGTYGGPPPSGGKEPSKPGAPAKPSAYYTPGAAAPAAPKPAEMPMVDVEAHLDYLAKTGPIKGLNWKMSINDLMALLGMDHKPQDIKDLAIELGCPEKEMADSYSRNVWTHKTLLRKIAENGGILPKDLLD